MAPSRIVSLCPSTTETVVALGCAEALQGITRFCVHPSEVVHAIEKVGGTKNPKIDQIIELKPDVVFMNEEENRREDYEALREAEIRVEVSFPKTIADVPDHLRNLGELLDVKALAHAHASDLEAELRQLSAARDAHPEAHFPFVYLIWQRPWMAVGQDTYVSDLLSRAGGRNVVAASEGRYPEITLDSLSNIQSLVVLLADEPYPFTQKHVPDVQSVVPGAVVQTISGDDACWHGIRSLRGARLARELFERLAMS